MSKKVIRVHFLDDQWKAFGVDDSTTAVQLKAMVAEKIGMKEHASFFVFEKKDGWERCLDPDEKPCALMSLWNVDPKRKETGKEPLKELPFAFVFKKKIFLRDDEKEMQDPISKLYVYIQAVYSVVESDLPCSVDDAIKLAGLQCQVLYGDHKPTTHVVGFLTQSLKRFVPKDLFANKKPNEWEASILKAHAQNLNKSAEDAMSEYLTIVKEWPFYGTTFFPPCKSINNKKLPSKVIIGVNAEGIVVLKKDKERISTHPFTEICSWASSSTTFAFEFGSQTESQKYTFETRQGAIIASTIQTYIDILVEILKNGEDEVDS